MSEMSAEARRITVYGLNVCGRDLEGIRHHPDAIAVKPDGIPNDRKYGATRTVHAGDSSLYTPGQKVINDRQLTIASVEDLKAIAKGLELPARPVVRRHGSVEYFMAEMLGINILVRTVDGKTNLGPIMTPGTVLSFGGVAEAGTASVKITGYNEQSDRPATALANGLREVDIVLPSFLDFCDAFRDVAAGRCGWAGTVHGAGRIAVGQVVLPHPPRQTSEPVALA